MRAMHLAQQRLCASPRRPELIDVGFPDALGLNGRLTVKVLGFGELSLVAEDVASVGQGENVIGVIRAPRTLHAVSIKISKMIGVGELVTVAQDPAQQVGRPERVGVLRLEHP